MARRPPPISPPISPSFARDLLLRERRREAAAQQQWRRRVVRTAAVLAIPAALGIGAARLQRWSEHHTWVVWRGDDVQANRPCDPCSFQHRYVQILIELHDEVRTPRAALARWVLDGFGIAVDERVAPEGVARELEACTRQACEQQG